MWEPNGCCCRYITVRNLTSTCFNDSGTRNSFVSYQIVDKLYIVPYKLSTRVTISTPLGENININDIYRRVKNCILGVVN